MGGVYVDAIAGILLRKILLWKKIVLTWRSGATKNCDNIFLGGGSTLGRRLVNVWSMFGNVRSTLGQR